MTARRAEATAAAAAAAAADSYARIVAALIRVTGDWTLAEDCAQEAQYAPLSDGPRTACRPIPAAG
ncbi:MAG: hypothetical protein ABWZ26_01460 [Candidatus Nanopelagicales bacterium]